MLAANYLSLALYLSSGPVCRSGYTVEENFLKKVTGRFFLPLLEQPSI